MMLQTEAAHRTRAIRKLADDVREHLYHMYTRKGWSSLGYESWQQYLVGEFEISPAYLRRQMNAGLIEVEIGAELGTYKESHLRPISEILDDPDDRVKAVGIVSERFRKPIARTFEIAAKEVYLERYGTGTLLRQYNEFHVDIDTAYAIARFLETCDKNSSLYAIAGWVTDLELLPILKRLSDANTETWQEIVMTWHIPSYPDQVSLSDATAGTLLAYLNTASYEHRGQAIETRKEFYALKGELTDKIIEAARDVIARSNADSLNAMTILIMQLDDLESSKD